MKDNYIYANRMMQQLKTAIRYFKKRTFAKVLKVFRLIKLDICVT